MGDEMTLGDELAVVTTKVKAKKKPSGPKKPKPKPKGPAKSAKAAGNGEPEKPAKVALPVLKPFHRDVRRAAELLKQAADPTRLTVLVLLQEGPMDVGSLCMELSHSQPAVSHHLALLRHGGLIEPDRRGKNNFYSLTDKGRGLAAQVAVMVSE